ncbi:MAG: UDP-glucose 4-epimerase GalE [Gammaproteobacteria bacterium]|nr:UDP-glucose 4-epimerase GalE [Gammaproteobacteria bacterium]MAY03619.1 UDP-glucose 4-epimerase GalE [Gammaproteobacteria bacterium]|tara:strand:+ start:108 stop:1082 length:975 start_codon:yes stop_codon:yes gene_type:complete
MNILVCGGAGYIGSHVLKHLRAKGHSCHVLDNFSSGHEWALLGASCSKADILDQAALDKIFSARPFDVVMHFCARSLVAESVTDPALYYRNNVSGTLNLLETMQKHGVNKLVFSSTAAIFGEPQEEIISEAHPRQPLNPYGHSKLMVEQMLQDFAEAGGLDSIALRYFNAAGADPEAELGEVHEPETHLIPNILLSLLDGESRREFKIFGKDYPTPDGTCVRDYIHVNDLASAHVLGMEYLFEHPGAHVFNLGSQRGYSVLEVMQACEQISGKKVNYQFAGRRPGDPARLVASSLLAQQELGWQAEYSLEQIIETAWNWHQSLS